MTTLKDEEADVKAAVQSYGAGGGDRDCKSHFLSLRYYYMMDYGSHCALYSACSGLDALISYWREEECLVLVGLIHPFERATPTSALLLRLHPSHGVWRCLFGYCPLPVFPSLPWFYVPLPFIFPFFPASSHVLCCLFLAMFAPRRHFFIAFPSPPHIYL